MISIFLLMRDSSVAHGGEVGDTEELKNCCLKNQLRTPYHAIIYLHANQDSSDSAIQPDLS